MEAGPTAVRWRKSSYSGGTGECVELAKYAMNVGVRDSKAPAAGHLSFSPQTWATFAADARDGRFDLP
ncbi:DUF397 domain-containing protein [Actinomadura meridiana]|uniref:DUF397 domain-containing protein n=1 Tax=Actinomadura meridiana TaxID=559626 RepID=A0ABP8C9C5_9ACTN